MKTRQPGCMGLSYGCGPGLARTAGVRLIRQAVERGVTKQPRP